MFDSMTDSKKETDAKDSEKIADNEEEHALDMGVSHELITQLDEAQKEAEKFRNDYLRSVADLENYRRRVIREKDELRVMAASSIIEGMLPIIDNLVLGIEAAHKSEEGKTMVVGFQMVLDQLRNLLKEHGVEMVEPKKGSIFDPSKHDCVSHLESEEIEDGKIIEAIRVGYLLNDRLLRPASVVVSKGVDKES